MVAVTRDVQRLIGLYSWTEYYRLASPSDTLHWAGSDHLGGTIRVLDGSFTALDGMRYKPYGEDRDTGSSLNTDRKFTGQTEDEAAGLYWYASRAYDPAIGRFVSPDSIVPVPGNPQALNRYSYVYNNPLKYVDPSGRSAEWFDKAWYDEFRRVHKRDPNESDISYRYHSMKAASQRIDWSVKHWSENIWPRLPRPVRQVRDWYKTTLKGITALDATGASDHIYGDADVRSERNAFKHAYWSALLTAIVGPELAKEITDEHEEVGMAIGQEPIDLAMDLINNEIGRGIRSKGMPVATLAPLLIAPLPVPAKEALIASRILEIRQDLIDRTVLAIDQGKLLEIREGRLVSTDGKL